MSDPLARRRFLKWSAGAGAAAAAALSVRGASTAADIARPGKAPYRVLYSNDTTNILSCVSPFHQAREPFRKEMLEAAVDEVAGKADAHFLQPGVGWVPWWPSRVYPIAEHEAWLDEHYGIRLDPFSQFVRDGGDLVQTFVDRCRKTGQAAFISMRLNDGHHKEWVTAKKGDKIPSAASQAVTRFYAEHPEYRLGTDLKDWTLRVHNWAIPEVRAHRFAFLQELCENYDLDGIELDFLRNYSFFDLATTTVEERCAVMTGFVKEVRALLDRTSRDGRHRWLCARVPCYEPMMGRLGLDLPALVAAGLDMVNLSANYFTVQNHDLAKVRAQVPESNVALYFEMCHSTWNGPRLVQGYDAFNFRRTTVEQYHTAAHHAYARGADGVSFFNFAYYREHGNGERGPFAEPPFQVLKDCGEPALLARRPQHWFLAPGWRTPGLEPFVLPRWAKPGTPLNFTFDLAPPAGGWVSNLADAKLRLQGEKDLGNTVWSASWNGVGLARTAEAGEPYANPYPGLLGTPTTLRAWTVPVTALREGPNALKLVLEAAPKGGDEAPAKAKDHLVVYLDLAVG